MNFLEVPEPIGKEYLIRNNYEKPKIKIKAVRTVRDKIFFFSIKLCGDSNLLPLTPSFFNPNPIWVILY